MRWTVAGSIVMICGSRNHRIRPCTAVWGERAGVDEVFADGHLGASRWRGASPEHYRGADRPVQVGLLAGCARRGSHYGAKQVRSRCEAAELPDPRGPVR